VKALKGVANSSASVKLAAQKSTTEAEALFCVHTAALMNQINDKTPTSKTTKIVFTSSIIAFIRALHENDALCLEMGAPTQ
jgi:hypothetical protein